MTKSRISPSLLRRYALPTFALASLALTVGVAGGAAGVAGGPCNKNSKRNCLPTISLVSPTLGAAVLGSVPVQVQVNSFVVAVRFSVDGAQIADDTSAPFSANWDSTTGSNGMHVVTAVARNANGETATDSGSANVVNPVPDATAPTVDLTSPASGATVSGQVSVAAGAADNVGVAGVQFKLDGAVLGAEDTSAPYAASWDTTSSANGSHSLTAVARDAAGNSSVSQRAVSVSNVAPDTTAPSVGFTSPTSGTTVAGQVSVAATAADNIAVAGVQFKLDGAVLGAEDTSAPYAASWNTASAANGSHTLTAVARDAAGNSSVAQIAVNVFVDTTIPTVSFSSPASGATVSGSVSAAATAADNVAVAGVQFKLDGAALGAEDTIAPFAATWNTSATPNGAHTLTAVARDAAGNTATATSSVTVSNVMIGSRLKWAPPALTNPITINVPATNGKIVMDNTRDYILKVGHLTACNGLWLEGGRNIVVIGGRISMNAMCASAYDRTAVKVRFNTGVVHLEGLLLDGAYLHDAIVAAAPLATLQIQNVRVEGLRTFDSNHPDCFQAQQGLGALRVDRFTCRTELQGFFLGDHAGPIGPVTINRSNIIGTPGHNLFWKSDTRPTSPAVNLTDVWLSMPTPWAPSIGHWVYPNLEGDTIDMNVYGWTEGGSSRRSVVSSDGLYVSFIGTNIVGGLRKGLPPTGDFVPAASVGTTYVSPGYGI